MASISKIKIGSTEYTIDAASASSVAWSNVSGKSNATTSTAGLMSAADKAKLDGLTSGGKVTIKTWTASDMS